MINTNRAGRLAASAALLGVAATLSVAPPAHADSVPRSCTVDGHILNARVDYTLTSTRHVWNSLRAVATGSATNGDKNNFTANLSVNGNSLWNANSADSYGKDEPWTKNIGGISTARVDNENFRIKAIFDEPFNDDECTALWDY